MQVNERDAFPTQFANYDLFNNLRIGASGNELLHRALEQARPEFESRRVGDISIPVSPGSSGPTWPGLRVSRWS